MDFFWRTGNEDLFYLLLELYQFYNHNSITLIHISAQDPIAALGIFCAIIRMHKNSSLALVCKDKDSAKSCLSVIN